MKDKSTQGLLPQSWRVKLPIFDGPLDLLLHLVRIDEVDISDIPVARICDQFHEYLSLMEELNLDIAGEYIYEAALLIYLKSKMLLPRSAAGVEAGEDPRQELAERLLEYRRIKEAAQSLAEVDALRQGIWTRDVRRDAFETDAIELEEVSLFDLLGALRSVLERYAREHPEPLHVAREHFSVRDQLDRLLGRLEPSRPVDIVEDLRQRSCRAEAVASFLAVLELVRLSLVRVHQGDDGAILLFRTARAARREELEAIRA